MACGDPAGCPSRCGHGPMHADQGPTPGSGQARLPAISAHRGGHEDGRAETYEAYDCALAAGADYLELDARKTGDGTLIASHRGRLRWGWPGWGRGWPGWRWPDGRWPGWGQPVASLSYRQLCQLAGYEVPRLAQVLPRLAGRARLHLDVKDPGAAAEAAGLALGSLGPADVVLTTRDQEVARMLGRRFPVLQAGLAVGGDFAESARFLAQRAGRPGLSRLDAVEAAGATWAALHHRQAAAGLAAECRERGLKTLVWTVNADRALARWLACSDVDVLVTDRPAHAVALRDRPATRAAGPDRSARPGPPDGRTGPVPGSGR